MYWMRCLAAAGSSGSELVLSDLYHLQPAIFAAFWWSKRRLVHGPVSSWKSVPPLDCVLIIIPSTGENSGGDGLPHLISTALLPSPSLLPHKASMGEPPPETRVCTASFSRLLRHSQVTEEVAMVGIPVLAVGHGGLPVTGGEGLVCSGVDRGWRALRVPAVLQMIVGANVLPTEIFTPQTCRSPFFRERTGVQIFICV